MVVEIKKQFISNIPVLEITKQDSADKALPVVIFVHGFTSAKEHNLHFAYYLAEQNMRVLLPEADLHGERGRNISAEELNLNFFRITLQLIDELETIKNAYEKAGKIQAGKIGVAGLSMGGIVTMGALSKYSWIKAAVCLMGSPSLEQFGRMIVKEFQDLGNKLPFTGEELEKELEKLRPYDITLQPETLANRPLLFWHGKKDPVVPIRFALDFYEKVKQRYNQCPERIDFIVDPNAEHKVTREGVLRTVDWFKKYLQ